MGGTVKYPAPMARLVGEWLIGRLSPHAERIEIAGSLRRGLEEVGDVEILYVPKMEPRSTPALIASFVTPTAPVDLVNDALVELQHTGFLQRRRTETGRMASYGDWNKFLASSATGIPIDLFRTTHQNWGMGMVVRTGPAEFNIAMMTRFRQLGMEGHAYGGVTRGRREIECPTEESVFELLGLPYLAPETRTDGAWLDAVGRGAA